MRIGKVTRKTTRPDCIPVKLPKQPKRIKVTNWPAKKPEPAALPVKPAQLRQGRLNP